MAEARGTSTRLSAWQHVAVMGAFLFLVSLYTYPLILNPGHLLPKHKDPFMYAWTMVSNVHRLFSAPSALFHGNTFYPHGNSVAFSDLLLTPTITAGPVYLLTGNPVLQYNLTLLIWWALSGWAMYVAALALLRSHRGATIAALIFTLSPYRTDYFLEFQMELAFPIPLALLCFVRFLETRRWPPLVWTLLLLWVEALASMYYAIILGLCLAVVAGLHLILRSGDWSWAMVRRLLLGGLILGVALAPFLLPYVKNDRELGLVRELHQPARHSADILTYFETGVTRLYRFRPSGHIAETSLFMGFVALMLAAMACVLCEAPAPPRRQPITRHISRLLVSGIVLAVVGFVVTSAWGDTLRATGIRLPGPERFFDVVLLLGLARIGLEGWVARRSGKHRGPLGERELRWILLFLIALFFVLSLGPFIHYRRRELGKGLYYYLYPYLVPLHAMRITTRIGVIVVVGVSLLAGLGIKYLAARLPSVRSRAIVTGLLVAMLLAEYASFPLPYQYVDWEPPPSVYHALATDPDDVAVLEWPLGREYWDDYFTFTSINHWKRLVNGASGFQPPMSRGISSALSKPDRPDDPFPSPEVMRYLLGIHPLRYLVVHNALLDTVEQQKWQRLQHVPWARRVAQFGKDDLYQLTGDMRGTKIEKLFSWDYARTRHEISFEVRPLGPAARQRWIEVDLNGHPVGRQDIGDGQTTVVLPLVGPLYQSAPNAVTVVWRYRRSDDGTGRTIGRTGAVSPADLYVVSGGFESGDRASILVNGVEYAQNRRGYNLMAIDAATGRVLSTDVFDTFRAPEESSRLAAAIRRVPPGTVVVAAVKDEASGALTEEAVAALRSLGGSYDIRGRYRVSHLLIGVKGAAPGTAMEEVGARLLTMTLGEPPERLGIELKAFTLR